MRRHMGWLKNLFLGLVSIALLALVGALPGLVTLAPAPDWFFGEPPSRWWSVVFHGGIAVLVLAIGQWLLPRLSELSIFERITERSGIPEVDVLVLPVSLMDAARRSLFVELWPRVLQATAELPPSERVAALAREMRTIGTSDPRVRMTWEVPMRVLGAVLHQHTPRRIVLLCSSGDDGSKTYVNELQKALAATLGDTCQLIVDDVDFADINEIYGCLKRRLDTLRRDGATGPVVIDVTGGSAPVSVAGMMLTMNGSHTAVYWQANVADPDGGRLRIYDVRVQRRPIV